MAHGNWSGCKTKDNDTNSSKKKIVNGKGSSTSGSGTTNTSGLRRSTWLVTLSKEQITSSPLNTWNSMPVENFVLTISRDKKSTKRVEKQSMSSPLRRCDRGTEQTSSSSSGSKYSKEGPTSSNLKPKRRKKKKLVKLMEVEDSRSEIKHDVKPVVKKRKTVNEHTKNGISHKRFIKTQMNIASQDKIILPPSQPIQEKRDKLCSSTYEGEESSEGGLSQSSYSSQRFGMEISKNNVEVESSYEPSDAKGAGVVEETLDDNQRVLADCPKEERLRGADTCETVASKDIRTSTADAFTLSSSETEPKAQDATVSCYKRPRCCDGKGCKKSYHSSCLDPPLSEVPEQGPGSKLENKETPNCINPVQKKYEVRMTALLEKQREEIHEFHETWEEKRELLEKDHRLDSALVRSIHSNASVITDKLKILDGEFSKKLEEHKCKKEKCLKDLEAKQLGMRTDEKEKAKSFATDDNSESVPNGPVLGCNFPAGTLNLVTDPNSHNDGGESVELEKTSDARIELTRTVNISSDSSEKIVSMGPSYSERQVPDGAILSVHGEESPSERPDIIPNELEEDVVFVDTGTAAVEYNQENHKIHPIGYDTQNAVGKWNDNASSSISGDSPSTSVQPVVSLACDSSLPHILVPQNDCSQSFVSIAIQGGSAQVPGIQSSLQQAAIPLMQPVEGGQTDQSNYEAPLDSNFDQMQSSLSLNLPFNTEHRVASSMSTLPWSADPLQNELERIRREIKQTNKVQEDEKVLLKSECEKEIEEMVASINRKYELEVQNAEVAFVHKKIELDINQNKVLLNKLLAEAFKSKFPDFGSSGSWGMQQVVPSGVTQQLPQSLHNTPRPSSLSSPTLGSQLALNQPTTPSQPTPPPTVSPLPTQPITSHQITTPSHPSPRLSPLTTSSFTSHQNTPPPPSIVHHSSPRFWRPPTRPPTINPITPCTGNHRGSGKIRAPAPHLQRYRPPSMSAKSPPLLQNLSCQSPSPPPLPPPGFNSSSQLGNAVGLPTFNNSSVSTPQFLRDIDNWTKLHTPNILPNSSNISQFGAKRTQLQVSSSLSTAATEVFRLSNDE